MATELRHKVRRMNSGAARCLGPETMWFNGKKTTLRGLGAGAVGRILETRVCIHRRGKHRRPVW